MTARYDVREAVDGLWEVFDVATGEVARLGSVLLHRLSQEEATSALEMLRINFAPNRPLDGDRGDGESA